MDISKDIIACQVIGLTKPVQDFIPTSEDIVSYCARVSNKANQTQFDTSEKLLKYCQKNSHWSVFETISLTMEIKCPRDIARQVLRHRSFSFQEFSQRYAEANEFALRECRLQDTKNRQNSNETDDSALKQWWEDQQGFLLADVERLYREALSKGIAKEVARVILPEGLTMSHMYMNGTVRSWLHYIDLRSGNGTQKEHKELAIACGVAIKEYLPNIMQLIIPDEIGV